MMRRLQTSLRRDIAAFRRATEPLTPDWVLVRLAFGPRNAEEAFWLEFFQRWSARAKA